MAIASIMAASVLTFGGASAGQASQDVGDGLAGAALCVAAADYLVAAGETGDEAGDLAATWRHIMTAVSADSAVRDAAVNRARAGLDASDARRAGAGVVAARTVLDTACRKRADQVRYLERFGKPELMSQGAE